MAFVIAFSMLRYERMWIKIAFVIYAVLIAYERIYVGVHFPLDVTAGAAIGIASAYVSYKILKVRPQIGNVKK